MRIVRGSDVSPDEWDAVCERSSRAWLFHRRSWIDLETQYHGHRDLSFGVQADNALVGIQPLYLCEVGIGWFERLVHSGIHRHTGFAAIDGLPLQTVRSASIAAMDAIRAIADAEQADRIQLNAQNLAPLNRGVAREEIPIWVSEYGFQLGLNFGPNGMLPAPGLSTCCADQIVELDLAEEELFARLAKGCRTAVRQAQKGGVEFEIGDSEDAPADYVRLAKLAAERTGESLPREEYFASIFREFRHRAQCQLLFARHDGRRVAAVLLLMDKGAISYLGGVSDPEALPLRVNNFLHWSAIVWAKGRGFQQYRFGPAFPEVPADWPIAKVSRFKTTFGGRSVPTIQGSCFLKPEKYLTGGLEQLQRLCSPKTSELNQLS